jgi:hypothetical protein
VQPSAAPEAHHTAVPACPDRPRAHAAHWLATAVGLAAVVMVAALVQPPGAAATAVGAPASGAPDPTAVRYPVDCAGGPVDVVSRAAVDLDADGRTDTVAVVRCHTETGTPPSGAYVLSHGASRAAKPRIVATLLDPAQKLTMNGLTVTGHTVSATLLGYSSNAVPRCCPDLSRSFSWTWRDGRFTAVAGPHAGSV